MLSASLNKTFLSLSLDSSLDINDQQVGAKMSGTYQPVASSPGQSSPGQSSPGQSARHQDLGPGEEIEYKGYTNPNLQSRSFHAVAAKLEEEGECMLLFCVPPPPPHPTPACTCTGLTTSVIVLSKKF